MAYLVLLLDEAIELQCRNLGRRSAVLVHHPPKTVLLLLSMFTLGMSKRQFKYSTVVTNLASSPSFRMALSRLAPPPHMGNCYSGGCADALKASF